jgi:Xaa-Pro aminopeptidase
MNVRLDKLKSLIFENDLDSLVISHRKNLKAFAGLDCDNGILRIEKKSRKTAQAVFYTDFRYASAARRVCRGIEVEDIKNFRLSKKSSRVGYEISVPHSRFVDLAKFCPSASFVDISEGIAKIRAVKTPEEIKALRDAIALNDKIWTLAQKKFKYGMTELEMARIIKTLFAKYSDGEAFNTIVCVGKNAAECHHEPDNTVWRESDPLLVDMGLMLNGYCSDMTRNILPRRPSKLYRKVYDLVKKANYEAAKAIKPNVKASDIDKIARNIIKDGGFGECFGHSLGHGVGLQVHEGPILSKKSDWTLEEGMIFSVEPGIYLEDNLGVRIEDLVLVTNNGYEVLTQSPKI